MEDALSVDIVRVLPVSVETDKDDMPVVEPTI
jgi:hypothetical protein